MFSSLCCSKQKILNEIFTHTKTRCCLYTLDRLASLRLVFDNGQKQRCSASPNLGGALVELSREYGLIVELETTDVIESVAPAARGPVENGADEATLQERSKSNILSTLRGKAQSLWNHGRFAFKTGETSGHTDKQTVGEDVENGPVKESAKRSSCSAVTTVDETAAHVVVPSARTGNGSARYRTLEYGGASAADVTASDGVQCCTINSSAPTATTIAAGGLDAIDGDDAKSNEPSDQQKSASPPPPRIYSTPVVIPSVVPASTCGRVPDGETLETTETAAVSCAAVAAADTAVAATTTIVIARGAADVATSSLPVAGQVAPRPAVENEFRASDDHYWCTTTSPLSTFGKRSAGGDATCAAGTDDDGKSVETTRKTEIASSNVNDGTAAGRVDLANDRGGVVCSRETVVIGDATCSIEDASLPSYSSDEDDDDDDESGVLFTEKVEPSLSAACAADPSAGVECRSAPRGSDKNASDRVVATTDCSNGRSENNADVGPVNSAVRSAAPEPPRPATKLPSLRPSLSSPPLQSGAAATTSSSPTNNNGSANHSPIVSKIPVRRQSAGNAGGTPLTVVSALIASNGGTAKKAIPLPLSRSGSRLAMWTSAN